MPPVDPLTGSPRFYYLHSPEGSPAALELTYPGFRQTTGPTTRLNRFRPESPGRAGRLRSRPVHRIPQPETDAEIDYIQRTVTEIAGLNAGKARFRPHRRRYHVRPDLSLYERYNRLIGTLGLPWWNIGGNHDLNFSEAPNHRLSRETFKRVYGPSYYAFNYARALFLMLDVDYLGHDPARPKGAGKYEGRLDAAQLEFVKQTLARTPAQTLIVIVMHIPIVNVIDPTENYDRLINTPGYCSRCSRDANTRSASPATPIRRSTSIWARIKAGRAKAPHHHHILTAVSRLLVERPARPSRRRGRRFARWNAKRLSHCLSVDGLDYKTRFVPAKEPNRRRMRLFGGTAA